MSLPLVPMSNVLKVKGGFAFKSKDFEENGYPIIRISNIDGATVNIDSAARIPLEKLGNGERFRVFSKDILIAMSGATTGKLGIVPELNDDYVYLNQRVGRFSLEKESEIDRKFLWFFLKSERCQQQIQILAEGAAQPNVSSSELESIKIPLPPLAEQKRIAGILDAADALRVKRREAISQLDALIQSTFLTLFGDPVRNPKGWEKQKMGDIMRIRRGGSPRPIKKYLGGTINWIKIGDATQSGNDLYIDSCAEKITEAGLNKTTFLEPGSFIFANSGVSLGFARILRVAGAIHDGWLAFDEYDSQKINELFFLKESLQIFV